MPGPVTNPPLRPELLAPAGDARAMRAAIANGADAVYFGLEEFNARRRAENFKLADLPGTIEHLHRFNVRGYITFNTLIFSDELPRAREFLVQIIRSGADGVIVQDLGLIPLIRQMSPDFPIHASTQMTQSHAAGLAWLREQGVSRVVLARELPLEQIRQLARTADMELEVFVHGALCISYSGQCLASHTLMGRSANRGQCAQACRLPYQLIQDGRPVDAAQQNYLLSPRDLAAHTLVGELVNAGVRAFKIEGRLKDARYVAATTRLYRQAIDAALNREPFRITDRQQRQITQCFSRGFSTGFLTGRQHQQLMNTRSPKTRGQLVGTVVRGTARGIVVALDGGHCPVAELIKPGDGVVFDEGRPDRDEQGGRVYSVQSARPEKLGNRGAAPTVELAFGHDDLNLQAVQVGSLVWKTDDPVMRQELEATFARLETVHRVAIRMEVEAAVGQALRITVRDNAGHLVTVSSAQPLEAARKHPLTTALLAEQLGRLTDTPFELATVTLHGPQGVADSLPIMAPKSVLNELRREIVEKLIAARQAHYTLIDTDDSVEPQLEMSDQQARLHVLVRTREQFEAVLRRRDESADFAALLGCIYGEFDRAGLLGELAVMAGEHGAELAPATLRIMQADDQCWLERIVELQPQTVLVRNLAAWRILQQRLPSANLVADQSLNVANQRSAALLGRAGFARITPACELSESQMTAMLQRAPGIAWELVLGQQVPMFHLAHCPLAERISGAADCRECDHPCRTSRFALRDRNGIDHPLRTDLAGRTTIYHAQPRQLTDTGELRQLGVCHLRIELLNETAEQTAQILEQPTI